METTTQIDREAIPDTQVKTMIRNPILKGFNPDPAIIRVGEDYYIATSTFEWFPGVQIHHSKDLVNWRVLTRPLNTIQHLNMIGNPGSCGVWAPCLSHCNGKFYLIFTDVKSFNGIFKDTHNYLCTATAIEGPWSTPIHLNSSGFDPSLFHDDDGRKWLVNMLWDHRPSRQNFFGGIMLQEFSEKEQKLVGDARNIYPGTGWGLSEGPHLFKRNGYYYMILAEGGTEYNHAFSVARARNIDGPYEAHPGGPVVTAKNKPHLPLQRTGHGGIVETQTGEWYITHLCGRPLPGTSRCTLGRETAIQKVSWKTDDWFYLTTDNNDPQAEVEAPRLPLHPWPDLTSTCSFNKSILSIVFQSLRIPISDDWANLTAHPGYLRIHGQESITSLFRQSLIARRWQSFRFDASVSMTFKPKSFQQMAGLTCYYNTKNFYYLYVTFDEDLNQTTLQLLCCDRNNFNEAMAPVALNGDIHYLKVSVDNHHLQFYHSPDGEYWMEAGPVLDASILSDEYCGGEGYSLDAAFTGAFVGMAVQDLTGGRQHADFKYFKYNDRA